jgi:hypothetical protein
VEDVDRLRAEVDILKGNEQLGPIRRELQTLSNYLSMEIAENDLRIDIGLVACAVGNLFLHPDLDTDKMGSFHVILQTFFTQMRRLVPERDFPERYLLTKPKPGPRFKVTRPVWWSEWIMVINFVLLPLQETIYKGQDVTVTGYSPHGPNLCLMIKLQGKPNANKVWRFLNTRGPLPPGLWRRNQVPAQPVMDPVAVVETQIEATKGAPGWTPREVGIVMNVFQMGLGLEYIQGSFDPGTLADKDSQPEATGGQRDGGDQREHGHSDDDVQIIPAPPKGEVTVLDTTPKTVRNFLGELE